jgi:hypothetical protein
MNTSVWTSNCRYLWATREQGNLTLVGHRGHFMLLGEEAYDIWVKDLDMAIHEADKVFPPEGWTWAPSGWVSEGWAVKNGPEGWYVCRGDDTVASKQYYPRADLARKWCEIRADRVGLHLRGPKPSKGV